MKISEILSELAQPGNTVAKVAKDKAGIGEKKLRKALIAAGYEFRNSGVKGWYFIGEGLEPLDKQLDEFVSIQSVKPKNITNSPNVKEARKEVSQGVKEAASTVSLTDEIQFTQEEAAALKSLLHDYITEKKNQTDRDRLHTRIMKLDKEGRTRKTVLMSESVGKRFDDFADQMRFNKSDILELALIDFMDSYEKGEE